MGHSKVTGLIKNVFFFRQLVIKNIFARGVFNKAGSESKSWHRAKEIK